MATFGKLTDGGSSTASSAARKKVSTATPATSGTVTKLTGRFWLDSAGTGLIRAVIYADSAGAPGALLAYGDEVSFTHTTEQAVDLPLSGGAQIHVDAGTPYWIGWHHGDPGTQAVVISRDGTASASQTNTDAYPGATDPFGAPTGEAGPIDCFATYTEDATDTTPTRSMMGIGS